MRRHSLAFLFLMLLSATFSSPAAAHCDSTKGPVVTAARAALDRGDVNLVLPWVRPEDEADVRADFERVLAIRKLGPAARELADHNFFESLVRIHRAAEGAPYTGLTDSDPEPIIAATDRALETGSPAEVEEMLVAALRIELAQRFDRATAARRYEPSDVAAARAFVANYVALTHWVEGIHAAAAGKDDPHGRVGHGAAVEHGVGPSHESDVERKPQHASGILQKLPWILAAVLAMACFYQAGLLLRHRRHAA